jgi:ketosteroid isomerase-like protein
MSGTAQGRRALRSVAIASRQTRECWADGPLYRVGRKAVAGYWAGDVAGELAALPTLIEEACDPDIEWVEDPQRLDQRVYRGHAGVRESWERWVEDFDAYGFEVERISDHGDRVLVVAVERGRGSTSEADVSARIYTVCTFRAGKILRYQESSTTRDKPSKPWGCGSRRKERGRP